MIMKDFKGPGFSMQVPTDWYITSNPQIQAMFISPPQEDGITANLMVTINPVKPEVTVQSIADETRQSQVDQYADYKILSEGFIKDTDNLSYQRVYEWFNKNKKLKVRQQQVMHLVGEMLYLITTTRPAGNDDTESIKRLDATLQYMLETFTIN